MKLNYYIVLVIIFFIVSSCTTNKTVDKIKNQTELQNAKLEIALNCPNYVIPEETKFLLDKNKKKALKLSGIKLECNKSINSADKENPKIVINQIIYYQVLKNKVKLNKNHAFLYLALVDEKDQIIQNKVLLKIKPSPYIQVRGKVYFKNKYTFKINNNKKNKNLIFYYGFQK